MAQRLRFLRCSFKRAARDGLAGAGSVRPAGRVTAGLLFRALRQLAEQALPLVAECEGGDQLRTDLLPARQQAEAAFGQQVDNQPERVLPVAVGVTGRQQPPAPGTGRGAG